MRCCYCPHFTGGDWGSGLHSKCQSWLGPQGIYPLLPGAVQCGRFSVAPTPLSMCLQGHFPVGAHAPLSALKVKVHGEDEQQNLLCPDLSPWGLGAPPLSSAARRPTGHSQGALLNQKTAAPASSHRPELHLLSQMLLEVSAGGSRQEVRKQAARRRLSLKDPSEREPGTASPWGRLGIRVGLGGVFLEKFCSPEKIGLCILNGTGWSGTEMALDSAPGSWGGPLPTTVPPQPSWTGHQPPWQ